jgi:hypothetical protein
VLHLPDASCSGYHNVAGGAASRALQISVGIRPQDQRVQAYCILAVLKIEEATYTCESRPKSQYPFYSTGRGSDIGEHGTTSRGSGDRVSALGKFPFTHAYGNYKIAEVS